MSSWKDKALQIEENAGLNADDIKKLLIHRIDQINTTELIKILESHCSVGITPGSNFEKFSNEDLLTELKLHGIDAKQEKRSFLLFLLQNIYANNAWKIDKNRKGTNCKPILLNENEYIVAQKYGLWKYNMIKNEWNDWINYGNDITIDRYYDVSLCVNHNGKKIYLHNDSLMMIIDYKSFKIQVIKNKSLGFVENNPFGFHHIYLNQMIHTKDTLHFITKHRVFHHYIYDKKAQTMINNHAFSEHIVRYIAYNQLLYLPSKQQIIWLAIGEMESGNKCALKYYSYNCRSNQWSVDKTVIKEVMGEFRAFHAVVTGDDKFILILSQTDGIIYVINTDHDIKCMKCSIRCPSERAFNVIVVNNTIKNELLSYGFIRCVWKKYEIGQQMFPPHYLIKLISRWSIYEELHLFIKKHYQQISIAIKEIIENAKLKEWTSKVSKAIDKEYHITNRKMDNFRSEIDERLDSFEQNLNDLRDIQNNQNCNNDKNDNHNSSKSKSKKNKKKKKLKPKDIYNLSYDEKMERYKLKNMRSDLTFLDFALNNPHLYILKDSTKTQNNYYWQLTIRNLKKNVDDLLKNLQETSIFHSVEIIGDKIIKLWFNDNIFNDNYNDKDKKIFSFRVSPEISNFRNNEYDSCEFIKKYGSKTNNDYELWSVYTESNKKGGSFKLHQGRYNGFDNIMKKNNFCYKLFIAVKINSKL